MDARARVQRQRSVIIPHAPRTHTKEKKQTKKTRAKNNTDPRDSQNCEVGIQSDTHTLSMAECLQSTALLTLNDGTIAKPHLIVNELHRSRLDSNREKDEGAQGDPIAEDVWEEIHGNDGWLDHVKDRVTSQLSSSLPPLKNKNNQNEKKTRQTKKCFSNQKVRSTPA